MTQENNEAPWWFKLAVVSVVALCVSAAALVLDAERDLRATKQFCEALHTLGHYETKVEARHCWVNLSSDMEYPQWTPAEWMNVG